MYSHRKLVALAVVLTVVAFAKPAAMTKADSGDAPAIAQNSASTVLGTGDSYEYPVMSTRITAYASVPDETDNTPFITANGTYVHDGVIATNMLPFGTQVEIPALFGDKVFTVDDRMNSRYKTGIDIWMATKQKAIVFGAVKADIIVLSTSTAVTSEIAKVISPSVPQIVAANLK